MDERKSQQPEGKQDEARNRIIEGQTALVKERHDTGETLDESGATVDLDQPKK